MSVYDEMYNCIEGARSTDACEYNVYSEMFDLIAEAEAENEKLRELAEVLVNCGRKYHTMSGSCPMFDADAEADDFCGAVQSARELGIEVKA